MLIWAKSSNISAEPALSATTQHVHLASSWSYKQVFYSSCFIIGRPCIISHWITTRLGLLVPLQLSVLLLCTTEITLAAAESKLILLNKESYNNILYFIQYFFQLRSAAQVWL